MLEFENLKMWKFENELLYHFTPHNLNRFQIFKFSNYIFNFSEIISDV